VVVAHCHAVPWARHLAVEHPDRVTGLVAIAPGIALGPPYPYAAEAEARWEEQLERPGGWALRNRQASLGDGGYRKWVEFFFDQQLPEQHSTKHYEDTVSWALDTDPKAMIAEPTGPKPGPGRGPVWPPGMPDPCDSRH
jgi:pimeloyl-ACP methyl ester carboxylesterase